MAEARISDQHIFPISQAFEGLLPSPGEKKNDGGQFFTPREIIRVIVETVQPKVGKTVYDPCFGSKEGKDAQARFPYKCGKAQILFLQHIISFVLQEIIT